MQQQTVFRSGEQTLTLKSTLRKTKMEGSMSPEKGLRRKASGHGLKGFTTPLKRKKASKSLEKSQTLNISPSTGRQSSNAKISRYMTSQREKPALENKPKYETVTGYINRQIRA